MIIGINATTSKSGGAIAHIVGLVNQIIKNQLPRTIIHLWANDIVLRQIFDAPFLIKHRCHSVTKNGFVNLIWQLGILYFKLKHFKCDILFSTTALNVCPFSPVVVLSQTMLPFDDEVLMRYSSLRFKLKCGIIRYIHTRAISRADGVVFLTKFAADSIKSKILVQGITEVIPLAIGKSFCKHKIDNLSGSKNRFRIIYISPILRYKNQIEVLLAVEKMQKDRINVSIKLVGCIGEPDYWIEVKEQIERVNSKFNCIKYVGHVEHKRLAKLLVEHDAFIFASTCESFPTTLLEAMNLGIPIACSINGAVSELIGKNAVFFNPSNFNEIADSIKTVLLGRSMNAERVKLGKRRAQQFTWENTADKTVWFIEQVHKKLKRS